LISKPLMIMVIQYLIEIKIWIAFCYAKGIHRRCYKKYQIDDINAADTNGKTALH
ncbi:9611_t:CDS:1, partial [Dentiscutata erythropus]